MDKRFLGILVGLFIIFVGIFAFSQHSSNKSSGGASSSQATNHVQGQNTKKVTVLEYGDYQCPICGAYYQPLKDAVGAFGDQIAFQFRNLPLTSLHPNAFAAARAAEAAGLQNKYFEMHDKLYEGQDSWASSSSPLKTFQAYAQGLGLDMTQFNNDYASDKVNKSINADLDAFKQTGKPQATPTIFINGQYVELTKFTDPTTGAPQADKIEQIIQSYIDKAH